MSIHATLKPEDLQKGDVVREVRTYNDRYFFDVDRVSPGDSVREQIRAMAPGTVFVLKVQGMMESIFTRTEGSGGTPTISYLTTRGEQHTEMIDDPSLFLHADPTIQVLWSPR